MELFENVKGRFGFGCMRLKMNGEAVDNAEFSRMIDLFMEAGFNYFDTAHGYIDGKSEKAIKDCLSSRYPRESYILADKLSDGFFQSEADIRPLFEEQLRCCGVEYFDVYLMHCLNKNNYDKYKSCRAFETAQQLKAEGKVRHVGFSFHDNAEMLDLILNEHPEVEAVQLQFNYLDYYSDGVQAKKCYDVCVKHGKPVIVMEPVKGGSLVNLPKAAASVLEPLGGTQASYALRFAAGFDNVAMVLSGMGETAQMEENLKLMKNFAPLNEEELAAVDKVREIVSSLSQIECTGCRYCTAGCPMELPIPDIFEAVNKVRRCRRPDMSKLENVSPSDCIECGACEDACPQHLEIRELLKAASVELGID